MHQTRRRIGFQRLSQPALVLTCVTLWTAITFASERLSESGDSAHKRDFVSPAGFLFNHVLAPLASRAEQLVDGKTINFPTHARVSRTNGPMRQIALASGDRFSADLIHWDSDTTTVRLANGKQVAFPSRFVQSISLPTGESEQLVERFEDPTTALAEAIEERDQRELSFDHLHAASGLSSLKRIPSDRPLVVQCRSSLKAARIQFWIRTEPTTRPEDSGRVTFAFGDDSNADSFELMVAHERIAVVPRCTTGARWNSQSVPVRGGWHLITVIMTTERMLCLVDEHLVTSGPGLAGSWRSIQFTSKAPIWIDDLLISELNEQTSAPSLRIRNAADSVMSLSGDEFLGRVTRIAETNVIMDGVAGELALPWQKVAAIGFHTEETAMRGSTAPLIGMVARVEWQTLADRPRMPPDRMTVTILEIDREGPIVSHPVLGKMALSWQSLSRIEPLFFGRDVLLDARRIHLGDSIRPDFLRPLPDGTDWTCEFELPSPPNDVAWLAMDVAHVEPSGPDTPPDSPFLKELRAGRLLTEVWLNDRRVADVNGQLRFVASSASPDQVRIPLPRHALQTGTNSIRLKQIPRTVNGSDFDDCEVSNLRLELRQSSVHAFPKSSKSPSGRPR